jgi:hypothetical protein
MISLHEFVLDFEVFDMKPPPPPKDADFRLVAELHRRLVEAASRGTAN